MTASLPFSHGARDCISKLFAWMKAVLILATLATLATLAQKWRLRMKGSHPVVLDSLVTPCPKYGLRMVMGRR